MPPPPVVLPVVLLAAVELLLQVGRGRVSLAVLGLAARSSAVPAAAAGTARERPPAAGAGVASETALGVVDSCCSGCFVAPPAALPVAVAATQPFAAAVHSQATWDVAAGAVVAAVVAAAVVAAAAAAEAAEAEPWWPCFLPLLPPDQDSSLAEPQGLH